MDEPLPPNTFSDLPRDCLLPAPDFPELGHSHSPAPFPSGSLDPARTAVKRTAEEDPEDPQNRPSKAPRLADSSSDMAEAIVEPEPALKDLISRELSCSVCTDIFHHPVTLTPCLHSFCGRLQILISCVCFADSSQDPVPLAGLKFNQPVRLAVPAFTRLLPMPWWLPS